MALTAVCAFAAKKKLDQYVDGTVIGVQSQTVQSPEYSTAGSNPSDAPLTSSYYEYDVSIRVGCIIYVGRYLTPFRYLPSLFEAIAAVAHTALDKGDAESMRTALTKIVNALDALSGR